MVGSDEQGFLKCIYNVLIYSGDKAQAALCRYEHVHRLPFLSSYFSGLF